MTAVCFVLLGRGTVEPLTFAKNTNAAAKKIKIALYIYREREMALPCLLYRC